MLNDLINKIFGKSETSKDAAKKRLKFALVYDKLEVSDDILKDLQNDIIDVISRYFEIDTKSLELNINKSDDISALVFNTPILAARRRVPSP